MIEPCDWRGLRAWRLQAADGASILALERGGQVVSWCTPDGAEQLYVSPDANTADGVAIRGGVPVCFPQFAGRGPLPQHGLVRTRPWRLVEGARADAMCLQIEDDADTRAHWPHAFALTLDVALTSRELSLMLTVRNRSNAAVPFMAALHSYLAVVDVTACVLHGLPAGKVYDNVLGSQVNVDGTPLAFDSPVDRVHAGIRAPLRLETDEGSRIIHQTGFADAVLWNPGAERARNMTDLPDEDWRRFVCVEAAAIDPPVMLAPGGSWLGTQRIELTGA